MLNSLIMLLFVTLGGIGAVTGALVAGISYAVFPFIQSHYLPQFSQLTFLGVGLGAVALGHHPDGFVGQVRWALDRLRKIGRERGGAIAFMPDESVVQVTAAAAAPREPTVVGR